MIQTPNMFNAKAIEHINSNSGHPNAMVLHLLLLESCGRHWRQYTNDLEKSLDEIVGQGNLTSNGTYTDHI